MKAQQILAELVGPRLSKFLLSLWESDSAKCQLQSQLAIVVKSAQCIHTESIGSVAFGLSKSLLSQRIE